MESRGSTTPLRYRKNGRLQACDPCRRRKVACDHARPVCGNCRRRRRPEPCEYTMSAPAQMRPRVTASESDSGAGEEAESQPLTGSTAIEPTPPTLSPSEGVFSREAQRSQSFSGHLGFTSFGDIYKEVGNGLSDNAADQTPQPGDQPRVVELPASTMEKCLAILRAVPEEVRGRALFDSHFNPHDGLVRPVGQRAIDSLYGTYGDCFGAERDEARLRELVRTVCANTARPFAEHEPDPELWMVQFTGENLRWETLGVLFSYWELTARNGSLVKPESRPLAMSPRDVVVKTRDVYRQCIKDCLELARAATEIGNTLLLYIYWKRMIFESLVSGDTSLSCWMYNGETVSLMYFLGLHVDAGNTKGPYKPTLASELRRRLLYKIFVIDKVVCSITGRPPQLGRRYVLTPSPLDLRDDYLVADEDTLARAVASLDEKGYNTDGAMHPITFWRARSQLMIIRDEIFEVSLGAEGAISVEGLYALKNRELEAAADVPAVLHFRESDLRDPDIGSEKLYIRLLMRLEHLQNLFFIERLLHRRGFGNGKDLLSVSFEMASTALVFWTNMDNLSMVYEDLKWLVMAYAAPGGGILCLELLKPSSATLNGGESGITRSSIVQLLSLMVGFLNWVSPREGNGDICANCRVIVQRVLDQALNFVPGGGGGVSFDLMEWDVSAQLDFNFDLLDTFEWTRPEFSWADLPA